jgi:NTP pyrophosphatase (non-canonical NTP hydrolase)
MSDPIPFQAGVVEWMMECFGQEISADKRERSHRFIEESLELVQATGVSREEVLMLVDYVYGRPTGEVKQETGGVMVTLAALCGAHGISMDALGHLELARVWTKIEQIRAKQAGKPRGSPLPQQLDEDLIPPLIRKMDER